MSVKTDLLEKTIRIGIPMLRQPPHSIRVFLEDCFGVGNSKVVDHLYSLAVKPPQTRPLGSAHYRVTRSKSSFYLCEDLFSTAKSRVVNIEQRLVVVRTEISN